MKIFNYEIALRYLLLCLIVLVLWACMNSRILEMEKDVDRILNSHKKSLSNLDSLWFASYELNERLLVLENKNVSNY